MTSAHTMQNGYSGICHGFMAINPAFFGDPNEIKAHFSEYLTELRESPKANGATRIYTHGEKEMEAIKKVRENGIPVNENTVKERNYKLVVLAYDTDTGKISKIQITT